MTAGERLREAIDREPRLARALLDVIPDLVFRLKRDGTFLDYLPARGLETYVPAEDFLGRNLRDVFPSFAEAGLEKVALALDTGREQSLEYELPIGSGKGFFEARYVDCSEDEVIVIVRDITEKRATAQKLRQSEERFRKLVEMAGDVILLLSPEGEILEFNREAERIYGRSRASLLGGSFYELCVPEADRDVVRAAASGALAGAPSRGFLLSVGSGVASGRTLSWNVERILDADGHPVGLVACGHDVTEQRALEESVLAIASGVSADTGERFFRHLARGLAEILGADVVMIGALSGESLDRIRTVAVFEDGGLAENFTYALSGSPCENVVGNRVCSYPSRVAERFPRDTALVRRGIEGYVGAPLYDSGGRALGIINVMYRREVPNVQLAESVLRIFATRAAGELEREKAARELHASEQLNRRIVESMPGGIVQASADGTVLVANEEAQRVLGLERDPSCRHFVQRAAPAILLEDGTPCPPEETPLARCLQSGQAQTGRVLGVQLSKEEVFWGFFNAVPLTVPGGAEVEGAVLMFVDITDRKRAEEERRSLEARVQHAQKLESLGILAGGIAHDFNNLLTGILGNVSLALDGLAEDAPVLGNLRRVERAAERAAELTNQMLAYAGKASFVVGPLSLNAVVRDLVPLLGSSVSKKAQLDYELDPTLPDIEGDRSQIEQVVMNLITNASDALDSGEGRIRIRTGSMEAELGGARRGGEADWVFLEIADTGSGMDELTRQRIFEPFFTTKFTGRGLGLAAVQGIVRGHGGRIRVESRVGDGTRFIVLLPVAPSIARSIHPATDAEPRAIGAGTVLVIDDEEAVREVAAAALELAGYEVLSASDGLEGVALFEAHHETIVAILLDASMPRMGGEDALARIRALARQVPVLVISGHSERDAVARFEGVGIEGFLQKPFRAAQLVAKVHRLAAARASRASGNSLRSQA